MENELYSPIAFLTNFLLNLCPAKFTVNTPSSWFSYDTSTALVNRFNSFYDEVTLVVVSNECSGNILFLCFYVAKLAPQGA